MPGRGALGPAVTDRGRDMRLGLHEARFGRARPPQIIGQLKLVTIWFPEKCAVQLPLNWADSVWRDWAHCLLGGLAYIAQGI